MEEYKILLMNGKELPCILKSNQPEIIENDKLTLDTTGEYLSIGSKHKQKNSSFELEAERQYNHHLFTENAWLLFRHAEEIMSDSRMFLTPVKVRNGIAYTGRSGFHHPTVGVYLEWWLNYSEAAIDANGNLVWYISGSPLSGRNCCSTVSSKCEHVKIKQRTRFIKIWSSFMEVNNRYTEAKQRCEAYSLEDLICKFRGEEYRKRIIELKYETRELVMSWDKNKLIKIYDALKKSFNDMINVNKKEFLKINSDKIAVFYQEYIKKTEALKPIHEEYVKRRKELKAQYHSGTIEGDYRALLSEAGKDYNRGKHELSVFCNSFMGETFPKNINGIKLTDVIREGKKILQAR